MPAQASSLAEPRVSYAPVHASPDELRSRAKVHMDSWRSMYRFDPECAAEELERANTLLALADEADEDGETDEGEGERGTVQ
jgi:hypothetical protein